MAKVKRDAEDFRVEEVVRDLDLHRQGPYVWYRVQKRWLTTPNLIRQMSRWLQRPAKFFSYGGLKDKHAVTTQYISVYGDGPEQINSKKFRAVRVGYRDVPIGPTMLAGNRFEIVLRDVSDAEVERLREHRMHLLESGLPNYFDDQRFVHQKGPRNSVALLLVRRRFEEAFRAYIAEVVPGKWSRLRPLSQQILQNWGRWQAVLENNWIPRSLRRALTYLHAHPGDFQGALYSLDLLDLRLNLSGLQSFFWNELLGRYLEKLLGAGLTWVRGAWQHYAFYLSLPKETLSELRELEIPMPGPEWDSENQELKEILAEILEEYDLTLMDFALPRVRNLHFSRHRRRALVFPEEFEMSAPEPDSYYPGRWAVRLKFFLPRGSYATMVIKRLLLGKSLRD